MQVIDNRAIVDYVHYPLDDQTWTLNKIYCAQTWTLSNYGHSTILVDKHMLINTIH